MPHQQKRSICPHPATLLLVASIVASSHEAPPRAAAAAGQQQRSSVWGGARCCHRPAAAGSNSIPTTAAGGSLLHSFQFFGLLGFGIRIVLYLLSKPLSGDDATRSLPQVVRWEKWLFIGDLPIYQAFKITDSKPFRTRQTPSQQQSRACRERICISKACHSKEHSRP